MTTRGATTEAEAVSAREARRGALRSAVGGSGPGVAVRGMSRVLEVSRGVGSYDEHTAATRRALFGWSFVLDHSAVDTCNFGGRLWLRRGDELEQRAACAAVSRVAVSERCEPISRSGL